MNSSARASKILNEEEEEEEEGKDTVDSIRLKKTTSHSTVQTIRWDATKEDPETDLDIDQLDADFQRLTLDFQHNRSILRKDPKNKAIREQLRQTMENMSQLKLWSSLLKTEDGVLVVKEAMRHKRHTEINQRKYEIDEVLKLTKAQSAVDICFLMDCTGSMQAYIDAAKTHIRQLTETIMKLYEIKPRLAFLGYRDITEHIEQLNFTDDVDAFRTFLDQVRANGGGDTCEDIFSGLELVPKLDWTNPNRLLVHICDAPCHGREYHDFEGDNHDRYPKGDPKQRELSKLLLDIKRLKIIYSKISLNDSTTKMFEEFALIYGNISEIHVENPDMLMKNVCQETSAIILSSIDMTMASYRTSSKTMKSYMLLGKEPRWDLMPAYPVHTIEIIPPLKLDDLFRPLFIGRGSGQMKIAPHPFAKGSLRFAFYGRFSSDECELIDVVFKEFCIDDPQANTLQVYQEHLEMQVIAQYLANQFNKEMARISRKPLLVVYADADLVQRKDDETKIYQVEARMRQGWKKWNNNSGAVSVTEYSTVLQAFSHWTYFITAGRLMVVDLQGVKAENAYLLTDPAIHCDNLLRFKHTRTNLGIKGMHRFFQSHLCSEVCSKLKLPLPEICSGRTTTTVQRDDVSGIFEILETIDDLPEETAHFTFVKSDECNE